MRLMCVLTVLTDTKSSRAIWLFANPVATSRSTSSSRAVNPSGSSYGAGVLVAGSVILAGQARSLLRSAPEENVELTREQLTTPFDLDGDQQW